MNNFCPTTIRRMTLDDLERVVQLDHSSFSLPWPESSFKFEIVENKFSRCWVAEISDDQAPPVLVGMIVAWLIIDEINIATFAVDQAYRRQGFAQRLLAHTLIDAHEPGGRKAFLEVRKGNIAARTLYTKFGFTEVGVRKKYYQDNGEDAVLMNLESIDIDLLKTFL